MENLGADIEYRLYVSLSLCVRIFIVCDVLPAAVMLGGVIDFDLNFTTSKLALNVSSSWEVLIKPEVVLKIVVIQYGLCSFSSISVSFSTVVMLW